MSVIMSLGRNISGGGVVICDGVKLTELVMRTCVLKHLHGRIIMGPFYICFHKGSLRRIHRPVISFIITKTFLNFVHQGHWFITNIQIYQSWLNISMTMVQMWDQDNFLKSIDRNISQKPTRLFISTHTTKIPFVHHIF